MSGGMNVGAVGKERQEAQPRAVAPFSQVWNVLQGRIFMMVGPLGALACFAALVAERQGIDALDRWALPSLAALLLSFSGLLGLKVIGVRSATRITFAATTLYFLLGLDRQFFWFAPHYGMLSESSYWFAVLYATAFIAFQSEEAAWVCSAIFGLSLLICGLHLTLLWQAHELSTHLIASSAQFLLTSAVLVAAQFVVGRLRQQLDQVRLAAALDSLTGLPNRRYTQQHLEELMQAGRGFSLVTLDIDHFKQVNDVYGHSAGDMVLRETAQVVGRHLGGQQLLGRWGGEEFVLVLPGLHKRAGKELAERVRRDLYQHVFDQVGGLTASFGVAERRPDDSLSSLMERADAALYAAKRQGRNGVRVAMDDGRLTRLDLPALPDTPLPASPGSLPPGPPAQRADPAK